MAKAIVSLKKQGINYCEICGYKDFPIILQRHHVFPKSENKEIIKMYSNGEVRKQPLLSRLKRSLIVCPNCHELINKGIITKKKVFKIMSERFKKKPIYVTRKISSAYQLKINDLKDTIKILHQSLIKRKETQVQNHNFAEVLKVNFPDTYKEVVKLYQDKYPKFKKQ